MSAYSKPLVKKDSESQYLELSTYPAQLPEGKIAMFMGVYIYSYLPPVMRLAKISDLFFDTNRPGSTWTPRQGVRYLVESFLQPGHYVAMVVNADDSFENIKPWYAWQKIWVKDEGK